VPLRARLSGRNLSAKPTGCASTRRSSHAWRMERAASTIPAGLGPPTRPLLPLPLPREWGTRAFRVPQLLGIAPKCPGLRQPRRGREPAVLRVLERDFALRRPARALPRASLIRKRSLLRVQDRPSALPTGAFEASAARRARPQRLTVRGGYEHRSRTAPDAEARINDPQTGAVRAHTNHGARAAAGPYRASPGSPCRPYAPGGRSARRAPAVPRRE
jgi:hypothetical protein